MTVIPQVDSLASPEQGQYAKVTYLSTTIGDGLAAHLDNNGHQHIQLT